MIQEVTAEKLHPEAPKVIIDIARRTIGERENIARSLDWVDKNEPLLRELLASFDRLITAFNSVDPQQISPNLINLLELKKVLGSYQLPTITELSNQKGTTVVKNFIHTMRFSNTLMLKGETTREEPYLAFHRERADQPSLDEQALVVGAIFHIYEELLAKLPQISKIKHRRDLVVDALIEVAADQKETELLKAVADTQRLNWIDKYKGFSSEFRQSQGLE